MSWTCVRCGARVAAPAPRCAIDGGRLVPDAELRTGTTLAGRYRLVEVIDGGSHALVYRGRHEAAGRDVAVKVMRTTPARDPLLRERFLREARIANRVRHPNVVDVTDVGEAPDGMPFLVMELLDGVPLSAELGEPWSVARVEWLTVEIARALSAGHALGVVHRDLKPDNVLLLEGERLKLVDFGIAHMPGERRLTGSAVTLGTPRCMAPEQVRAETVTDRTDIYALACIAFEAVTGQPPFVGGGPEVMAAHLTHPPPPLPAAVSEPLASIIASGLAKVAADRPTAVSVLEALTGRASLEPAASHRPSEADRLGARRDLARRLLDHVHPDGGVPETIAVGLADVARAIAALRTDAGEATLADRGSTQTAIEGRIRAAGFVDGIDVSSMRALASLGSLAREWLALDAASANPDGEPPPSLEGAHAVLDAIEAYIESHPDGASLLPRRRG